MAAVPSGRRPQTAPLKAGRTLAFCERNTATYRPGDFPYTTKATDGVSRHTVRRARDVRSPAPRFSCRGNAGVARITSGAIPPAGMGWAMLAAPAANRGVMAATGAVG